MPEPTMAELFARAALIGVLLAGGSAVFAQEQRAAVRVDVRSDGQPVSGATVRAGAVSVATDASGTAALNASAGSLRVTVSKEGFLDATAELDHRGRPRCDAGGGLGT